MEKVIKQKEPSEKGHKCKEQDVKACPVKDYIEDRLQELEDEETSTLNPLDRIEVRARINELEHLIHYMGTRAIKGLLKEVFEEHSKNQ